jgi:hypothetical protein
MMYRRPFKNNQNAIIADAINRKHVYVLYTVSMDDDFDIEIKGVVSDINSATKWEQKSNGEECYHYQGFELNKI